MQSGNSKGCGGRCEGQLISTYMNTPSVAQCKLDRHSSFPKRAIILAPRQTKQRFYVNRCLNPHSFSAFKKMRESTGYQSLSEYTSLVIIPLANGSKTHSSGLTKTGE